MLACEVPWKECRAIENGKIDVSIIVPIHNGSKWIENCLTSILEQTAVQQISLEICICNDASTDNTLELLDLWRGRFENFGIVIKVISNNTGKPKGVGYAKNASIGLSSGEYLCFQDIDDVMLPDRILQQYRFACSLDSNTLIGCKFKREPIDSTVRYTAWANNLTKQQLDCQVYTSHGPTIIMPTWFCHKNVYQRVGRFDEGGKGVPEDLIFFYDHIENGGKIARVDEILLIYTYHLNAATFSVKEETIWALRLQRLEKSVLTSWKNFTIWNAGKQGRKFYNSLSLSNRDKVLAFCDVDVKKVNRKYTPYDPILRQAGKAVEIVHYQKAQKPFVICVKQDLTGGQFEENLLSLNLIEGLDYIFFS